jgi:hypothetical protein
LRNWDSSLISFGKVTPGLPLALVVRAFSDGEDDDASLE